MYTLIALFTLAIHQNFSWVGIVVDGILIVEKILQDFDELSLCQL